MCETKMAQPSPRDFVVNLTTQLPDMKRKVRRQFLKVKRLDIPHLVFQCLMKDNYSSCGTTYVERRIGYNDPFKHIKNHASDNDVHHLVDVSKARLFENRKYTDAFNSENRFFVSITSREKAMFAYLNLVNSLCHPVSYVYSPIIRTFAKLMVCSRYCISKRRY